MIPEINRNVYDSLSSGEKDLLKFIRTHQQELIHMNIQDFSKIAFVSPATVIRLCKKLNLEGYNELKYTIKQMENKSTAVNEKSLELRGTLSRHLSFIKSTKDGISETDLKFAADCLCSHKNIYLFGRGLTYMPLTYMYNVLLSVDRDCICHIDPPLMYQTALSMNADDVAFILSSSGSTDRIRDGLIQARNNNATIIALTSERDTDLEKLANVTFHCSAQRRYLNDIDVKSRFSILFIIDVILNCYFHRMNLNPPSDPGVYVNLKNW